LLRDQFNYSTKLEHRSLGTKKFRNLNKSVLIALFVILLSSSVLGVQQSHSMTTVKLKHLGVLQLAAHDLFDVDRTIETNFENGLLDLSTLLVNMRGDGNTYSDAQIMLGGEFRNGENVMIFTVASELGQKYVTEKNLNGAKAAKQAVLTEYRLLLEDAYFTAFGELIPAPRNGCATMTENLALRTVHDFLPGFIEFQGSTVSLFLIPLGSVLSSTEPQPIPETERESSPLDGNFDNAFKTFTFIPPPIAMEINLLQKDQSFGTQFNTEFSFDDFLLELNDGSYDSDDEVMKQIKSLFAKGYGKGCSIGGSLIPIDTISLLLAGVQMTTSWLIPILVAGAGIGFVLVRRK